jgi:hypothetical protein
MLFFLLLFVISLLPSIITADSDDVPLAPIEITALTNFLNAIGCPTGVQGVGRAECTVPNANTACPATGTVYTCNEGSVSTVSASSMGLRVPQLVLPSDVGRLSRLVSLDLGNNSISGTIPASFGALSSLVTLRLGGNAFSGSIPLLPLSALTTLVLSSNDLSGTLLPSLFTSLTRLRSFHVANNALSGSVPLALVAAASLTSLQIHNNQFAQPFDTLLTALSALSGMREFIGARNSFSGEMNSMIGRLTNLRRLTLTGCGIGGTIPTAIQDLRQLAQLHLDQNEFVGGLPSLAQLTALTLLRVHFNAFVGDFEANANTVTDCIIQATGDKNCWSSCRTPVCCENVIACNRSSINTPAPTTPATALTPATTTTTAIKTTSTVTSSTRTSASTTQFTRSSTTTTMNTNTNTATTMATMKSESSTNRPPTRSTTTTEVSSTKNDVTLISSNEVQAEVTTTTTTLPSMTTTPQPTATTTQSSNSMTDATAIFVQTSDMIILPVDPSDDILPIAIGAGVGGCVLLLLVAALICFLVRRRVVNDDKAYNDETYDSAVQMDDAPPALAATINSTVDDTLAIGAGAVAAGGSGTGASSDIGGVGAAYGTSFSPIKKVHNEASTVSSFSQMPSPPKSVSDYGNVPQDLNEVPHEYDRAPSVTIEDL